MLKNCPVTSICHKTSTKIVFCSLKKLLHYTTWKKNYISVLHRPNLWLMSKSRWGSRTWSWTVWQDRSPSRCGSEVHIVRSGCQQSTTDIYISPNSHNMPSVTSSSACMNSISFLLIWQYIYLLQNHTRGIKIAATASTNQQDKFRSQRTSHMERLPPALRSPDLSESTFKRALKTQLFSTAVLINFPTLVCQFIQQPSCTILLWQIEIFNQNHIFLWNFQDFI